MEVDIKRNIYLYGKYYDTSRVDVPKDEENWDLRIYVNPVYETQRKICSLEGIFISEDNSLDNFVHNPVCRRDQIEEFEEKFKGKFFPFEK